MFVFRMPPKPALWCCSLLLTGCSGLPAPSSSPDTLLQRTQQDNNSITSWEQLGTQSGNSYLNDLIRAPELTQLTRQALAANPGLQQTLLTLRISQQTQRQTNAARLPGASASLSESRGQDSDTSYTGSLTVSWEADVWRKLSDSYQASSKDTAQQQALYQSARDTLVAEVMQAWLQGIAYQRAIRIDQQRIESLQRTENLVQQRFREGLKALNDLSSARSNLASARATLEADQESLRTQGRVLQQLLGQTQKTAFNFPAQYPVVQTAFTGLPAQTLQRRPDLKAAYLAIEAAGLRTRAAYKELLPSFSLQAALEDVARSPLKALLTDPAWSLLSQLSAPLYQGGELKAAAKSQELATQQAYQAYRETLLTAVKEVEDAISNERSLQRQQAHVSEALTQARQTYTQTESQYRNGLATLTELLEAQQSTHDLYTQLDNLIYQQLDNRVALGLSLGLEARP